MKQAIKIEEKKQKATEEITSKNQFSGQIQTKITRLEFQIETGVTC